MMFEGRVAKTKGNKFWEVEIPLLEVYTQGRSKKDALAMIKEAIELLVEKRGFRIEVIPGRGESFKVRSKDTRTLISLLLERQRQVHGLSVREVAARMNSKSPNAYAQYEQGRVNPTLEKLNELLRAIDPGMEVILKVG